jgi:hypothetical protein
MAERNVTDADIEAVLSAPLIDRPSRDHPDRRLLTGRPGGRKVTVVVVTGSDPLVVVTVWADD